MSRKHVLIPAFASAFFFLITFSAWLSLLMLFLKVILIAILLIALFSLFSYAWGKCKARRIQNNNGQGD